jgi:predicted AAA+ superfamily ATPase
MPPLNRRGGIGPQIYFWRTSTGAEIDLAVDNGLNLIPVDVKLSTRPGRSMAKGIDAFRKDIGKKAA